MAKETNLIELLLQQDAAILTSTETAEYKVKSLTEKTGTDFILVLQGLKTNQMQQLRKLATTKNKGKSVFNEDKFLQHLLLHGIKSPDFNNLKLCQHLGAATPQEAITKLFNAGEAAEIATKINELSGVITDAEELEEIEEEIKN